MADPNETARNERMLKIALSMFAKWIVVLGIGERVRPALQSMARGARDEEERGAIRLAYVALEAAERQQTE